MTTAYATKRSLWRLCAEYIKMPPMHDTDFIRLTPDSFMLRWIDAKGARRADYRYWAGKPLLHVTTEGHFGGMYSKEYYPDEPLISGLGMMKKVSS